MATAQEEFSTTQYSQFENLAAAQDVRNFINELYPA
jgi:hypothetical protein